MIDRTIKALLLAIALGLWANVASPLITMRLDASDQSQLAGDLADISRYVRQIANSTCSNGTIC